MCVTNGVPQRVGLGWTIPLDEAFVTRVSIDHTLTLLVWIAISESIDLMIESDFAYFDCSDWEDVAWEYPRELGRFADLFGAELRSIELADAGELSVKFLDGRALSVSHHPSGESFQVQSRRAAAEGGFIFVCLPSGVDLGSRSREWGMRITPPLKLLGEWSRFDLWPKENS